MGLDPSCTISCGATAPDTALSAHKVGQRCVEAGERETKALSKEAAWDGPLAVKDDGRLFAQ
jgi:hypothetical protein